MNAELFFELFRGLPRQGPGDTASTLRALALAPPTTAGTRILDVGCGTGAQTLVLAQHTPADITAIDVHPPFIEILRQAAQNLRVAGRVHAQVADMRQLDFPAASFDLVWSEGAIYSMGFDAGLDALRPLLKPGGHVAVTEVAWLTGTPSPDCRDFWNDEYPAIRADAANLAAIQAAGYETVGHFALPASSWWDDYYAPLEQNLTRFRARHAGQDDAQALATAFQREIDVWHNYAAEYAYVFYVMRRHQ